LTIWIKGLISQHRVASQQYGKWFIFKDRFSHQYRMAQAGRLGLAKNDMLTWAENMAQTYSNSTFFAFFPF